MHFFTVHLRVAVCNPCSVQMHIASCLNTDSSCPAINLNKDLVLDAKLGVSTRFDWAKVTCHTRLPFICAVKTGAYNLIVDVFKIVIVEAVVE